jgi:hypothetical protein
MTLKCAKTDCMWCNTLGYCGNTLVLAGIQDEWEAPLDCPGFKQVAAEGECEGDSCKL